VEKLKEHDENLSNFLRVAAKCHLTFNEQKYTYSAESICLLGYRISEGNLSPDSDRVKPLLDMPIPKTNKELRRVIGLLAYYARWILHYSDIVKPLVDSKKFPLSKQAISCFEGMRKILAEVTLKVFDETQPFTVETDASNIAISAILHQAVDQLPSSRVPLTLMKHAILVLKRRPPLLWKELENGHTSFWGGILP